MTVAAPPAEDLKLAQIARQAVAECRPADEPVKRFEAEVLAPLRAWCAARADRVQAAYITPPKNGYFWAYAICRNHRDWALDEEVSQLTDVFRANGWRAFASCLPPPSGDGSYLSFYDPATALLAYADR
jgi:hypothetical protein